MTPALACSSVAAMLEEGLRSGHERGIAFPGEGRLLSHDELLVRSERVAGALRRRGLGRGRRVALLLPTSPELLIALVGVLRAGAAVVPLPHPGTMPSRAALTTRLVATLEAAEVGAVLADASSGPYVAALRERLGQRVAISDVHALEAEGGRSEEADVRPEDLAIVQYTSGSTADPKGVALRHRHVCAGIRAIVEGAALTPVDVNAQWLPLHHDMGLVGCLSGMALGLDQHLWSPAAFVRRPHRWLVEHARRRATIYAGPSFSYRAILERVRDEDLAEMDLSALRVTFNGAEVVDPHVARQFVERFAPVGLAPEALMPVYGMAEATLAVTFPALDATLRVAWLDPRSLAEGCEVRELSEDDPRARGVVALGAPVRGIAIRVVDASGAPLPEGRVGQVAVRGESVMDAYLGRSASESGVGADGWLATGDLGLQRDGELYVTGRAKEMIIVRGAKLYPADVEPIAASITGVYEGRTVAFSRAPEGREAMVILAETVVPDAELEPLRARVKDAVLERVGLAAVEVHLVKPRSLARTTSGKLQRALMQRRFLAAELDEVLRAPARVREAT